MRKRAKKDYCPLRRERMAQRIAYGLRILGACEEGDSAKSLRAAWFVLTWKDQTMTEYRKPEAVKAVSMFLAKLRRGDKRRGRVGQVDLQYAATWETTKAGVLHCNLMVAPWVYVNQKELQRLWGHGILWVERVQDDRDAGKEAAAAYNPEGLARYTAKLESSVASGRAVGFSKGWPKRANP